HQAHSTTLVGLVTIKGGDERFRNNLFIATGQFTAHAARPSGKNLEWISSFGLWGYDTRDLPLQTSGNVYFNGAEPYVHETNPLVLTTHNPNLKLVQQGHAWLLQLNLGTELTAAKTA